MSFMYIPLASRRRQRGATLFVSLLLLLALTLVSVFLARTQMLEERMALNDNNQATAVEAAEAALRSAEAGLLIGTYTDFAANSGGLYTLVPADGSVMDPSANAAYPTLDWSSTSTNTIAYTGPTLPVVQQPRFIIEQLPAVAMPGTSIAISGYGSATPTAQVYRVTAHSYGGDGSAAATLQSIVR
jgi:type IV pilus assembly protein PilX